MFNSILTYINTYTIINKDGFRSWLVAHIPKFGIIIIGIMIHENNKLQNVSNTKVATSHKIFYAQSSFTGLLKLFYILTSKSYNIML